MPVRHTAKMGSTLTYIACLLLLAMVVSQSTAVRFNEIWATDVFGTNMSFQKYDNKLVLMHQLNLFSHPAEQVGCLNSLYDRYHDRGLEIVAVSSWSSNLLNRRLLKYYPRFDLYSRKHAKNNIDAFLSSEPLARIDHRNIFYILQDMETFLHLRIHSYLCDPKQEYRLNGIKWDIEYYLTHSPTNHTTEATSGTSGADGQTSTMTTPAK